MDKSCIVRVDPVSRDCNLVSTSRNANVKKNLHVIQDEPTIVLGQMTVAQCTISIDLHYKQKVLQKLKNKNSHANKQQICRIADLMFCRPLVFGRSTCI